MVGEVLSEIEEEAAADRGDRPVLGAEKMLYSLGREIADGRDR